MKRRKFLSNATMASSAILYAPIASNNQQDPLAQGHGKGFVTKSGETRFDERMPFRIVNENDLKVSAKDTMGNISLFEYIGKEKAGPPLHIHFDQDEIFFVVEGEFLFQIGNEKIKVTAGDTVFGPRNLPHTWMQMTDKGKLLYLVQPSGTMEQFFSELSKLNGPPSEEEIQKMHLLHGMNVLGPPLTMK